MAKISTSLTTDPKNIEIAKEVLEGKKQMMKVRGEEIKGETAILEVVNLIKKSISKGINI